MSGVLAAVWEAVDPAAIRTLHDTFDAEMNAWFDKVKALIIEADPEHGGEREVWTTTRWGGRKYLMGYGTRTKWAIPEGWRVDRDGRLVPRRTGAVGKAWAARFDQVAAAPEDIRERLPGGMPSHAFHGLTVHSPGMDLDVDGRVFIYWRHDPTDLGPDPGDLRHAPQIDEALWRRVKLSDYYAAKGQ